MVKRVVEKSTTGITYPMLTRSNYTEWSLVMSVNLQAAGLWDVIEFGDGEFLDDRNALAAILRAVPPEMQATLAVRESATEAWETIRTMRIGAELVREANAEKLRRDFADLAFKPGECVKDFVLRVTAVASELHVLGETVRDKEVIKKILHSVPEKLEQVAISIETLVHLDTAPVDDIVGHLRAAEQRKKKPESSTMDSNGRLLLT